MEHVDVVIIGGGVVGTAIAQALGRYKLLTVLYEREVDLASGTSRANSGIVHSGYHCAPGTNKGRLCARGNRMLGRLTEELHVPFRRNGSLTVSVTPEEGSALDHWLEQGKANGVPRLRIIGRRQLARLEPNLCREARRALFAPTGGVISPHEMTFALGENARANGVDIRLSCPVEGLAREGPRWVVSTPGGAISTRIVVNAAGLGSEAIARMAGDDSITLRPRRGEEYLLDQVYGRLVTRTIFPVATGYSKGILVIPTVEGNLMLGPTDVTDADAGDLFTTSDGYAEISTATRRLVPSLPGMSAVIASFAGLRASSASGDFVIGPSQKAPGLLNVAGIDSPGLTAAPAIAAEVVRHIKDLGLTLGTRRDYVGGRPAPVRFRELDDEARADLAAKDPLYRHVVCRCELVTEAEIVDAVRRGARTLDGVKLRVRAGMGRCQGGFCSPKVMAILSRELGVPITALTKRGPGSEIVAADLGDRGGEADAAHYAG